MLKNQLIHPQILAALAKAGHSSRVLISDGNFPHWTHRGPNAEVVYLNLSPGKLSATDVLDAVLTVIPIEAAGVMQPMREGAYAMAGDPPIWDEFRASFKRAKFKGKLEEIERFAFYKAAMGSDICLTIATGEQRIYGNILLTIGVVK